MLFEEFFKKKRIDVAALQGAEPALFSEFQLHYTEMGEKSFDHTKKYWFNKLRRQFPLAVEAKTEKVKVDNPLAEQTITESLIDPKPAPKLGFVPKFKAAATSQPAAEQLNEVTEEPPAPSPAAPKLGFTPRFKAANMPNPAAEQPREVTEEPKADETPAVPAIPKPGFTPRFKVANMPKPAVEPTPEEITPEEKIDAPASENTPAPKPVYKPRFNPKNLPKKDGK